MVRSKIIFPGLTQRIASTLICLQMCSIAQLIVSTISFANITLTSSNLPIIVIDTNGQVIRNSVRITATMGVIDNGAGVRNSIDDGFNNYFGNIAIEIRGSSGQWKQWPKIQYGFETQTANGENYNAPLLGLPPENDWILYPPYSDKSLLRNVLAYHLSNAIGRYAPRTRFCELVLNGDYRGIYVLIEKIKRDKNRVDIATLRPEDMSGDQLTGGYIVKVDRRAGEDNAGWLSPYREWAKADVEWLYHDPGHDELTSEQKAYIQNYIVYFETSMRLPNWRESCEQYLDLETFIDYYLLTELALNIDTYTFSTFFYKDRDSKGGRLTIGPVWDFNLAYGNADYFIGMETTGWLLGTKIEVRDRIPFWLKNLNESEEIQGRIADRWRELRTTSLSLDSIHGFIDACVDTLQESQARNFTRWPILGEYVWPNFYVGQTWEDEIRYFKAWLTKRWYWMDGELMRVGVDNKPAPAGHFTLHQNYPNPFNRSTMLSYELAAPGYTRLYLCSLLGQKVRTLVDGHREAGQQAVLWDGLLENGSPAPTGVYLFTLQVDKTSQTRKLLLLP